MWSPQDEKVASVALSDYRSYSERNLKLPDTEYIIVFISKKSSRNGTRTMITLDLSIDVKYGSRNRGMKPLFEDSGSDYQSIRNNLKINVITKNNKVIIFVQIIEAETSGITKINVLHYNIKHLQILNIIQDYTNYLFDMKLKDIQESIAPQIFEGKLDLSTGCLLLQDGNINSAQKEREAVYTHYNNSLYFEKGCSKFLPPYQFEMLKQDIINDFESIMCSELDRLSISEKPLEPETTNMKMQPNYERKSEVQSIDSLNQNSTDCSSPEKEDASVGQSLDLMNLSMQMNHSAPKENQINSGETHEKQCQTDKNNWAEFINSEYDSFKNQVSKDQDLISTDAKEEHKEKESESKPDLSAINIEDISIKEQLEYTRKFYLFEEIRDVPLILTDFSPVGLPRVKNLCYMNSALQCLSNTALFSSFFIPKGGLNPILNQSSLSYTFGCILKATRDYYQRPSPNNLYYLKQKVLPDSMNSLRAQIGQRYPIFKGFEQQDAFEFLMIFLEVISQELNTAGKHSIYKQIDPNISKCRIQSQSSQHFQNMLARENSIVTDLFCGQLETSLTCMGCNEVKVTFESSWALSLAIKEGRYSQLTLEQLLENFCKDETCPDSSPMCGKCKDNTTIQSRTIIWRLPEILIITIKRSQQSIQGYEKDNTSLSYPLQLDMTRFCKGSEDISAADPHYTLYGVINHTGTLKMGHYTADCVNLYNKGWYHVNDDEVSKSKISHGQKEVKGSPYILFYVRNSQISK